MATVSKAWLQDFNVVVDHYQLVSSGEKEWFKRKCKDDMAHMEQWVTREAAWIKAGCPAQVITKWGRVIDLVAA